MSLEQKEEEYNPYCKGCNSCGHDGCCSWLNCFKSAIKHENCEYGESYIQDAKLANEMANASSKIFEKLRKQEITALEAVALYDKTYSEIYDKIYKQ